MAAACGRFPSRCEAVKLSRAHLFVKAENEDLRKARKLKSWYVGRWAYVRMFQELRSKNRQLEARQSALVLPAENSHEHQTNQTQSRCRRVRTVI